jgi:hypothetical protein
MTNQDVGVWEGDRVHTFAGLQPCEHGTTNEFGHRRCESRPHTRERTSKSRTQRAFGTSRRLGDLGSAAVRAAPIVVPSNIRETWVRFRLTAEGCSSISTVSSRTSSVSSSGHGGAGAAGNLARAPCNSVQQADLFRATRNGQQRVTEDQPISSPASFFQIRPVRRIVVDRLPKLRTQLRFPSPALDKLRRSNPVSACAVQGFALTKRPSCHTRATACHRGDVHSAKDSEDACSISLRFAESQ